ncbi:NADH-ubiquinone oxidoreductase [Teratosphaeria destructans]|uniref:NADH-ubiquinone oxidoreductase n=1 Tax=Teratosphaeria destructans TaxID=418781 RepID=A0A9W7SPN6_9PEZI|nr:NADH-ubiquinone oxidoreductase [Teratosphaeria destructans]
MRDLCSGRPEKCLVRALVNRGKQLHGPAHCVRIHTDNHSRLKNLTTQRSRVTMAAAGSSAKSAMSRVGRTAQAQAYKKYTVQPTGIWARINNWLAVDPKRSTGVPLNPQFRNPPPGGNDPTLYDDPVTVPAGDLAENPYWKRDVRRQYPRLSVVRQPDVVALLTVGSAAAPKEEVLQIGEAGTKQLVALKDEGERGLSTFFQKDASATKAVLAPNGLPPLPPSRHAAGKRYELLKEQTYGPQRARKLAMSSAPKGTRSVQEIVLSCGTCQATVSELYATKESNLGFHSDSGDEVGFVTKLWFAECTHIICQKCLPGGGVSFFSEDRRPHSQCPQCFEQGDEQAKELWYIRGLDVGEYEPPFPQKWLQCPPDELNNPGTEALRFQYTHILRYAQGAARHWKNAEQNGRHLQSAMRTEREQCHRLQNELLEMQTRVEELEQKEAQLQKWEMRKPEINHYLSVVGTMAKDIAAMRGELQGLGYEVPQRSYMFQPADCIDVSKPQDNSHRAEQSCSSESSLVARDSSSRSRKRKLAELVPETDDNGTLQSSRRKRSRELMPPPFTRPRRDTFEAQGSRRVDGNRLSSHPPFRVYEDEILHLPEPDQPQRSDAILRPPASEWNRRALPLRPLPRPGGTAEHTSFEPRQSSTRTAVSHRDHASTQTSTRRGLPVQTREPHLHIPRSRISQYESHYGTFTEPERDVVRQPLQELSTSILNRQLYERPPSSHHHQSSAATAPAVRQSDQARASVPSPFFSRSTAPYPAHTLPANRSLAARPRHPSPHQMAAPIPPYVLPSPRLHQPTDQPRPISPIDHQSRIHVPNDPPLFRRPPPRSQLPRHPPQPHRTAHILPSVASRTPPPPRARVTLTPDTRPRHSQEQLLSRIPGVMRAARDSRFPDRVRGGKSREGAPLVSQAGGRRSVRR